jgi:exosortase
VTSTAPAALLPKRALDWKNPGLLGGLLLVATGIVALRPLSVMWSAEPNYSFGWLIPVLAIYFFAERWPTRPARQQMEVLSALPLLLGGFALLWAVFRLAAESDPSWRPGLWILTGLYVAVIGIWLAIYGGVAWVRHFAFPVGFLFLGVPWPFGLELPLVLGLMRMNAVLVAASMTLGGVDTTAIGNVIHLPNCQLGVEEACSGILSLQASLMLGCLLGEIYQLPLRHRFGLAFLSMGCALVGNYGRTLFLAIMAAQNGPSAVTRWHDTAGFSILVFTGVASWLACRFLVQTQPKPSSVAPAESPAAITSTYQPQSRRALRMATAAFTITLFAEFAVQAWYGWRESSLVQHPTWAVHFPATPSFKPIDVSPAVQQTLHCDEVQAGSWQDAQGWKWASFWFGYKPKSGNATVLGWHTPNNCLPSVGWHRDQEYPLFTATPVPELSLDVRTTQFSTAHDRIYVFWVIYPTSGNLPAEVTHPGATSLVDKIRDHLRDIWRGYRGVGVETLETAVEGAPNFESARNIYLNNLHSMIVPRAPGVIIPPIGATPSPSHPQP